MNSGSIRLQSEKISAWRGGGNQFKLVFISIEAFLNICESFFDSHESIYILGWVEWGLCWMKMDRFCS